MNTNSSLTSKDWLAAAQDNLKKAGIETARLDCLILLEDATGKDRSYLLAVPVALPHEVEKILNNQVGRRSDHEPLSYIRGKSEFYGREFKISPDTLEPRPETETMMELLKQLANSEGLKDNQLKIADIGTGSGCLAITAKLEIPQAEVIAADISPACLKIAELNSKKHNTEIKFLLGDLLEPLDPNPFVGPPSVVLANLPYVPDSHTINQAAMHEPTVAIFGGPDGLDLYRRLFKEAQESEFKPVYIFTESLPFQHKELVDIAMASGYAELKRDDFVQVFKFAG